MRQMGQRARRTAAGSQMFHREIRVPLQREHHLTGAGEMSPHPVTLKPTHPGHPCHPTGCNASHQAKCVMQVGRAEGVDRTHSIWVLNAEFRGVKCTHIVWPPSSISSSFHVAKLKLCSHEHQSPAPGTCPPFYTLSPLIWLL